MTKDTKSLPAMTTLAPPPTEIPREWVEVILRDYAHKVVEDLQQLIRDIGVDIADMQLNSTPWVRRVALMNAITVVKDSGRYVKPWKFAKVSDLVATNNQSQVEPLKSAPKSTNDKEEK